MSRIKGLMWRVWTSCAAEHLQSISSSEDEPPDWSLIGGFTHSEGLLAESSNAVPHLILTAAQRNQRHITVTQVGQRAVHTGVRQPLLRPHVAVVLRGGETAVVISGQKVTG